MRKPPNGTWVAILLTTAIALSIVYAIVGGDEPLFVRDRGTPTPIATPGS